MTYSSSAAAAARVDPLTPYTVELLLERSEYCQRQKKIAIAAYFVAHFSDNEQQKLGMIQKAKQNFRVYTYVQDLGHSISPLVDNYDEFMAKAYAARKETLQGEEDISLAREIMHKLRNKTLEGMKKLNRKPDESLPNIKAQREGKK